MDVCQSYTNKVTLERIISSNNCKHVGKSDSFTNLVLKCLIG